MTRAYRFWTPEEEAEAKAMKAAGATYRDIANALGRSERATQQAFVRMTGGYNKMGRTCSKCPTPISDTNKCGMCKSCNLTAQNYDKEFKQKRIKSLLDHPTMRAGTPERRLAARKAAATRMANPEFRERLTKFMREVVGPKGRSPEVLAKKDMKAAGRKISARQLWWCPESHWEVYRAIRRKGVPCDEAKAMTLAQYRADQAAMSPFERQERALAKGARLIANDIKPSLANPGYYEERKAG